ARRGGECARQVRELLVDRDRGAVLLARVHQHGDGDGALARGGGAAAALQLRRGQRGGGTVGGLGFSQSVTAQIHVLAGERYFFPPLKTRKSDATTDSGCCPPPSFSSSPASSQVPLQEKQRSTCTPRTSTSFSSIPHLGQRMWWSSLSLSC